MSAFVLLKFAHVLLAIFAVGANLTYGAWLALAGRDATRIAFTLHGIRMIDRAANSAYGLLLITGLILAAMGGIPYQTFWVAAALVLYAVAIVVGIVVFAPASRRQRALLAERGPDDPHYRSAASFTTVLGIATTIDVLIIVFLMVTKPSL